MGGVKGIGHARARACSGAYLDGRPGRPMKDEPPTEWSTARHETEVPSSRAVIMGGATLSARAYAAQTDSALWRDRPRGPPRRWQVGKRARDGPPEVRRPVGNHVEATYPPSDQACARSTVLGSRARAF